MKYSSPSWLMGLLSVLTFGLTGACHLRLVPQVVAYDIFPSTRNYPRVPADDIVVYPAKRFAPRGYLVLANLRSGGDSYCATQEELFKEFRKKASELGADAVVVLEVTGPGSGGYLVETGSQPPNDLGYLYRSNSVGITQVVPRPTPSKETKPVNFKGYALAIRTHP